MYVNWAFWHVCEQDGSGFVLPHLVVRLSDGLAARHSWAASRDRHRCDCRGGQRGKDLRAHKHRRICSRAVLIIHDVICGCAHLAELIWNAKDRIPPPPIKYVPGTGAVIARVFVMYEASLLPCLLLKGRNQNSWTELCAASYLHKIDQVRTTDWHYMKKRVSNRLAAFLDTLPCCAMYVELCWISPQKGPSWWNSSRRGFLLTTAKSLKTIEAYRRYIIPVVPHKAVAEVSK